MMTSIAILAGDGFPRGRAEHPDERWSRRSDRRTFGPHRFGAGDQDRQAVREGVLFRLGRLRGTRGPGLRIIIPLVDVLHRVSLRIVTLPRPVSYTHLRAHE